MFMIGGVVMDTAEIKLFQLSSLDKVYLDDTLPEKEYSKISVLKNEKFSYQIAYNGTKPYMRRNMKITVRSPLAKFISVRLVGNVPSEYPFRVEYDDDYERVSPGLFPDVLYPIENETVEVLCGPWHSLWITAAPDGSMPGGNYPIEIVLSDGELTVSKTMQVEVIDALLPEQEIIFTQWFHADCLADYYQVPVFSERHWTLIDQFIKTAAENGINMMLTPIFTPPLDTQVGHARTQVQLVDIEKQGERYSFGFDKLRRWIALCKKNGIKYYEMAHLFTQWGLEFTPNITAMENGASKQIFGWHVSSDDPEYENFLSQFLPHLTQVLEDEGISKNTFFHISDEPHAEHLERYCRLKEMVKKYLSGYEFIDALSDYAYYSQGVVDHPIPATNRIQPFIEHRVPDLWAYYCCSQGVGVSNRFMAMPSYRNRVIGVQFYQFDIRGFLHWGYNFYNSALSLRKINPFLVTDCINTYPSGDAFSVYPGENGPLESLRLAVFYDALQDLRAFKLLESCRGRDVVEQIIKEEAQMEIRFDQYPHNKEFILRLRDRVNREIGKYAVELEGQ